MSDVGSSRSSVSSASFKPIPREQAFLESFFCAIGQFCFDRAHEIAEKEKETFRPSPGSVWSSFLTILVSFANAEKTYFSLCYVEKKLLRREALRPLYATILNEFQKLEEVSTNVDITGNFDEVEILAIELSKHLAQFVTARQDLIDMYVFMAKSGWSHHDNRASLVSLLEDIISRHSKSFHHPILDHIKTSISLEVEIVHALFQSELMMSQWKFLPSLLSLYDCQGKLNSWNIMPSSAALKDALGQLSSKSTLSGNKKNAEVPFLYKWLWQFHQALVSKFTLYFHTTLISQTNVSDMKSLTSKSSVDYFLRLSTFLRKSDAYNVSLVLETMSMDSVFTGHGYHLPNITRKHPEGLKSYPAVVSIPEVQPIEHWPNVVSLLKDREQELHASERIVYFFDEVLKSTYYLTKLDTRITLVAIFNSKKKEKDSYVTNFFSEIRSLLLHDRLYQMLKPGQGQKFR